MHERTIQSACKYATKMGRLNLAEDITDRMIDVLERQEQEKKKRQELRRAATQEEEYEEEGQVQLSLYSTQGSTQSESQTDTQSGEHTLSL